MTSNFICFILLVITRRETTLENQKSALRIVCTELLALATREAGEKLLAGEIDAAFMVASWDAPQVQQLLADERIAFPGYPYADAYVALYPFLSKVVVPRGVRDLAKDQPPADVVLIAAKASLVVRKDLHPAIQLLLLNTAVQIHSGPGIFQHANEFPAAETISFPLSDEALRFYKSGPPFLHNYLPFWMAELIGKLIILLIPILGVLYPMVSRKARATHSASRRTGLCDRDRPSSNEPPTSCRLRHR